MTRGKKGAYVRSEQMAETIEGFAVEAVDTTGAGDTFTGAFCVALAEGKSILDAIRFGNAAAGISVTRYGVVESIPTRDEIEKRLEVK